MRSLSITFFVMVMTMTFGCHQRGADDRIILNEEQRQLNHGPGYTVVAMRPTDRARVSQSGAIIVNPSGYEPVYVTDTAYMKIPHHKAQATVDDLTAINEKLSALQQQLERETKVVSDKKELPPVVELEPVHQQVEAPETVPPPAVNSQPLIEAEAVEPAKKTEVAPPAKPARRTHGKVSNGPYQRTPLVDRNRNPIVDSNGNPIGVGGTP
jgi:hypothetical protein